MARLGLQHFIDLSEVLLKVCFIKSTCFLNIKHLISFDKINVSVEMKFQSGVSGVLIYSHYLLTTKTLSTLILSVEVVVHTEA